ncbi:coproporphyrinogen-III oxidase family protein [Myxococcus sp. RHSTA-1-4]|uniref:coproporphyrinogen-III oxidase family protein n=1 Tax=Myxococcus sp. RHSTA-1-4 TaxID=2874601 RepID=UPI001CC11FFA|nr:radical SAM protein [Myxococcus sp. RHSTA-1-4]MBZ4418394.1 radical SAM protein [Myxococcus sp. RHSTA-1-4]
MYRDLHPVTYYFYPLLQGDYAPGAHKDLFDTILDTEVAKPAESLLYVHIPYCHDLCQFCPFHIKIASGEDVYERYTTSLCREMELLAQRPSIAQRTFSAVYFGGGSPSILPVPHIRRLLEGIHRHFRLTPGAEISFEGEPRTLGNPELLELLKEWKVSRLSFGLQTYDEVQRQRFRIVATLKDVERVTVNARRLGFHDINVDMMYDLPGQNLTTLNEDLAALRAADFDSVDYYNLHYYAFPKKFRAAMDSGEIPPKPGMDMHMAMTEHIRWHMREMGYNAVADQVFSKYDKVCEYFRLLWGGGEGDHSAETVAVGTSARGYLSGVAYMNTGEVNTYCSMVEQGQLPVAKLSARLERPENRGAVFMPKFFRISKRHQAAIDTIPADVWKAWQDSGLIYETPGSWELSEHGKQWTPNMMLDAFESSQRQVAGVSLNALEKKPGVRTGTF